MTEPYKWDDFSDQPYQLKDKEYKRKMRSHELFSLIKTFCIALVMLPVSLVMMPFVRRKSIDSKSFFSMGVDFEREPKRSIELLDELGVERILLRLKLWEMEKLESLKAFILANPQRKIILKIIQDTEHIQDLELCKKDMQTIFGSLENLVDIYEIGTTINRAKWGFFSVDQYLRFYQVAYALQQNEFQNIKLIGSGVIDFEYHFTTHTLFNLGKYRFDGTSSLLYVDRRGAPENLQMGFDLSDKIAWLSTMVWLSPKSAHALHITETNWPLSNTKPYAPTSEHECVSEELYADFMLRYHLLAFASQQVDTLSWHQLIAPGYGLIDNRDGIVKRKAFATYKFMLQNLKEAQFLRLDITRGYYILQCLIDNKLLQIHWSLKDTTLQNEDFFTVYTQEGTLIKDKTLNIGSSPLYIHIKDAV
ncbi:MAG: glycosyl hydrolase [Sulfurimonas sp.]